MNKDLVISVKTILFTFLLLLGAYITFRLGPIIAIILVAGLLTISVENTVQHIMKVTILNRPMPRSMSVLITYLLLITFVILVITLIAPPFVIQVQKLLVSLTAIINEIKANTGIELSLTQIIPQASNLSSGVFNLTLSLFSNVATFFFMFVISIYLSMDWPNLKKRFISIVPEKFKELVRDTVLDIERSVGNWLKGELFLMTFVGLVTFIGLVIIDVDYSLALGLLSGMLEAVPMIGQIFAASVATIIGFSVAPAKGIAVLILFVIIQQVENNIVVPKVMGKISGFSPLAILLALLIGSTFFGIVGAILAVPMTIIIVIIVKHVLRFSASQD